MSVTTTARSPGPLRVLRAQLVPRCPLATGAVASVVVIALLVGVALPYVGVLVLVPIALTAVLALTALDRGVPLYVAVLLGTTALPSAVPVIVRLGPVSAFAFEPFLYLGAGLALLQVGRRHLPRPLLVFAGVVVLGTVGGLLAGNGLSPLVSEVRPTVTFLVAVVAAWSAVGTVVARRLAVAIAVSLWISLPMTLLGSLGLVTLGGREESALTGDTAGGGEAVRLLTSAVTLAFAVTVVSVVLAAQGRVSLVRTLPWLVPAVPVVVLAFTRSQLIGLAAAAAFTVLAVRRWSTVGPALRALVASAAAAVALVLLGLLSPAGDWMRRQLAAIGTRTLGLARGPGVADPSVVYRERESRAALRAIGDSPLVGHGFGASYQLPTGQVGSFYADQAPYFNHDYYLWLALKVGLVGVAVYLVLVLVPLVRILLAGRAAGAAAIASGAAGTAWVVVNAITPQPLGFVSGMVAGGVLGCSWALAPGRNPEPVGSLRPVRRPLKAGAG